MTEKRKIKRTRSLNLSFPSTSFRFDRTSTNLSQHPSATIFNSLDRSGKGNWNAQADPGSFPMILEEDGRSRSKRSDVLVSGATHQTCPRVVADLSYRTTSCRHFALDKREIVLVSAAQSTRIRHVNFVRTSTVFNHPYATGLTDPQYRHQALSHYVRSANESINNIIFSSFKRTEAFDGRKINLRLYG